jgi:hypothetical protein
LQVKVRGHRVEPAEVEAALATHPDVAAAVVVAVGGEVGHLELAAYVVPNGSSPPSAVVLRRHLVRSLPRHLVPTVWELLAALPLTRNGKVDRAALPSPVGSLDAAEDSVRPTSPTEKALAAIWSDLLEVPAVGRFDDFFALGGDSLLLSQMHARLVSDLGVNLSLQEVYRAADLAGLAAAVDSTTRRRDSSGHAPA